MRKKLAVVLLCGIFELSLVGCTVEVTVTTEDGDSYQIYPSDDTEEAEERPANEEVIVDPDAEEFVYNVPIVIPSDNPEMNEYDVAELTLVSASTNSVLISIQNVTDYPIKVGIYDLVLDDVTYDYDDYEDSDYPELTIEANSTDNYYFTAPHDGEEFVPISNPDFTMISGYYTFTTENAENDLIGVCMIEETVVK